MSPPTKEIQALARSLGFDVIGIARVDANAPYLEGQMAEAPIPLSRSLWEKLRTWLFGGFHADMSWLERDPYRRSHPESVLSGCRSLVMVGLNYWPKEELPDSPDRGRVARYAWGKDYHKILEEKLKTLERAIHKLYPGEQTKRYVDTGPIMEKPWAQQAGLGWIGKHTNLVSTEFGSWLLLGEILTTALLDPDEPATDLCGSCTLCIQACPTGAIVEPYVLNAQRCISYLTIEHRGILEGIPEELRKRMGNKIFGCDDCLDICPFNIHAQPNNEEAFKPLPFVQHLILDNHQDMTNEDFLAATRNSPLRRSKHKGFLRNIQIAIHNRKKPRSATPIE